MLAKNSDRWNILGKYLKQQDDEQEKGQLKILAEKVTGNKEQQYSKITYK